MTARPLAAVVLAAGKGKRMRSALPKVLLEACGRALVEHVLEALRPLAPQPTVVVCGHGAERVRAALKDRDVRFALQEEQLGTGHAVQCALRELPGFRGDLLVVLGDTPLLDTATLQALLHAHRAGGASMTVLTAEVAEPGSLGRIVRGRGGRLERIVEWKDAREEERAIREINTGVLVADAAVLPGALARLAPDNAQREYYLTDVPALLLADGRAVEAWRAPDPSCALGVNTPSELARAAAELRRRAVERLLAAGVWVEDPATTLVDAGVEVGEGTLLRPFTHLMRGARVGARCTVGPHAVLREGVVVGDDATVGSFVELARCRVEAGARVEGLARLEGASLGAASRVGAGAVTDGTGEGGARTVVGDGARVGAGAILVAPATVGEGATVKAGSVVGRGAGAAGE